MELLIRQLNAQGLLESCHDVHDPAEFDEEVQAVASHDETVSCQRPHSLCHHDFTAKS
jgi:hypothetical protein